MDNRPDKELWFLKIARVIAERSTCIRRAYGCIIVNSMDEIISTGYNGAPRGINHCNSCYREDHGIAAGEHYEKCYSIHAEMNALLQAGKEARGCNMYINGISRVSGDISFFPCIMCSRIILNSGIKCIIIPDDKNNTYMILDPQLSYMSSNLKGGM